MCKNIKAVASPMHIHPKVNQSKLKKSPIGKRALELAEKGIKEGYLKARSVKKFLQESSRVNKKGTCFGQASAVMVADRKAVKGKEKKIVAKANKADALGMQLLSNMAHAAEGSVKAGKAIATPIKGLVKMKADLETIDVDLTKLGAVFEKLKDEPAKKEIEKQLQILKSEKNKLSKEIDKTIEEAIKSMEKGAILPGAQVVAADKLDEVQQFGEEVKKAQRELLEVHSNYTFIREQNFVHKEKNAFLKSVKKLISDSSKEHVVRLNLYNKSGGGHAVALFSHPRMSMYDSNIGLTKHKNKKSFIKTIEKLFCHKGKYALSNAKIDTYSLEIFTRK